MSSSLLDTWQATIANEKATLILPDGCRDLIIQQDDNASFSFRISPLFDHAKLVSSQKGSLLKGYRFKPGARINETALIKSLKNQSLDQNSIFERIDDFSSIDDNVAEVLSCLASGVFRVSDSARLLGVSTRTLQRLVLKETQKSPSYWIRLAKVRQSARELIKNDDVGIAYQFGYADQAHFCREVKYWFGLPMTELKKSNEFLEQISDKSYA